MSLAGVVLAAGRSERMGAPKALLDYRGEALLWSAFLQALAALQMRPRLAGRSAPCPRAPARAPPRNVSPHGRSRRPTVIRRAAGQPVIWDESLFQKLATSEAATRHGALAVLHARESQLAAVAVDDPAVIDDVNTPADYDRLVRGVRCWVLGAGRGGLRASSEPSTQHPGYITPFPPTSYEFKQSCFVLS